MIEEQAIVKALKDDTAIIEVQRQNACHSCELNAGCGTGSLGRLLGFRRQRLSIKNPVNLKIGDRVVIGLPDRSYLSASFLIYLLPLIFLFVFAAISHVVFGGVEWLNVISGLGGLGAGLWLAGRLSNNRYADQLQPQFIRQIW